MASGSKVEWLVIDPDNPTGTLKRCRSESDAEAFILGLVGTTAPWAENGKLKVVIGKIGHAEIPPGEKTWRKLAAFGVGHPFWKSERAYLPVELDGGYLVVTEVDGEFSRLPCIDEGVPLSPDDFFDLESRVDQLKEALASDEPAEIGPGGVIFA